MDPRLSPSARTSGVLIPRQLAPTVGLSHDGFEFLKANFEGLKGYAVGRMTKSRRGNQVRVPGPLRRNLGLHRQDWRTRP